VLPQPTPVQVEEESPEELNRTDDAHDLTSIEGEESDEDALARAIRKEQQEIDT
ncbi:chromosome partitioning protein, partial [Pseudomonas putida]|nr:chromosome partitioning protein [Pseudomonas putida]